MSGVNDQLLLDLASVGVRSGKPLLIRAALDNIGEVEGGLYSVLLPTLKAATGPDGTLVAPHFSNPKTIWSSKIPKRKHVSSGILSRIILQDPDARVSDHSTHSFVALGQLSKEITSDHPAEGACFEPVRKIIEYDGDMLLLGCVGSSPGFSTVHLVQHDLGILKRHYYRFFIKGLRQNQDRTMTIENIFESPGCSRGFGKFYSEYMQEGIMTCGFVGKAYAVHINARKAYELESRILSANRKYYICANTNCASCRLLNGNNIYDFFGCLAINIMRRLRR